MAKILVVDDDRLLVKALRQILEFEGHEVAAESCGTEVLARLREEAASAGKAAELAIIDIILPGKGGLEVIQEVREEFPEIKIIAVTAGSSSRPDGLLRVAKRLGANRILDKPFDGGELLQSVRQLVAEKQIAQAGT